MTNVERARPLKDAARSPTRHGRRTGLVLLAEQFVAVDLRRLRDRCRAALRGTGFGDERTGEAADELFRAYAEAFKQDEGDFDVGAGGGAVVVHAAAWTAVAWSRIIASRAVIV